MTETAERKQAFLALFVRSVASIEAFVHATVRDRSAADDLMQEIAVALWASFDTYDASRPFSAWGKGVASHIVMGHYRKRAQIARLLSPATLAVLAAAAEEPTVDHPAEIAALRLCIERLPGRARKLLTMRYEQGFALAEIATGSNVTAEGVRKALSRLRLALKICVHKRMRTLGEA